MPAEDLIGQGCQTGGGSQDALQGSGRRGLVSRTRAGIAYLWLERLGQSGPVLARALGLRPPTIYEAARRGQQEARYWERLFGDTP